MKTMFEWDKFQNKAADLLNQVNRHIEQMVQRPHVCAHLGIWTGCSCAEGLIYVPFLSRGTDMTLWITSELQRGDINSIISDVMNMYSTIDKLADQRTINLHEHP